MGRVETTHGLVCQRDQAGCHAEESFEETRAAGGGGQDRGRGGVGVGRGAGAGAGEAVLVTEMRDTVARTDSTMGNTVGNMSGFCMHSPKRTSWIR